ncbi:MAG: S41 family peptidase [Muribaculaceae bacterium]|nr:S41 family peptidase [Muribaculaceae bacterium]MDE6194480.1 S41 family peptidase [Muribaculaceae bacterium]
MKRILLPFVALTMISVGAYAKKSHDMSLQRNLKTFNAMVKTLEENYVDSIRIDEAFKAASNAMLNTVDPYTEYYTSDDKDELMKMTTGEYAGIGSYITEYDGKVRISQPVAGSPAAKAGLMAGDWIVKVDTTDTKGLKSGDVSKLLRGNPGTDVYVEVVRPYMADSLKSFTITREKVGEKSVPYFGMVSPSTGYIRLTSYISNSPQEIAAALDSLKGNPGFSKLILDLRGNGGGLVESAIDILGNFLPKGTQVLRTSGSGRERIYKTTHTPSFPDMPLAVLTDGATASASEITAGALQDLDRAVLIGNRSFGKGLVQNIFPLPHDASLKVTVAKYYIPSGRLIQALDYSRRNPDGSVARTPDSLTNVYYTSRGREVRDGGGLKPDSVVENNNYSDILYNLVTKNRIFDFATRYRAAHPEAMPLDKLEVTDDVYAEFTEFVVDGDMKYDTSFDALLKELRKQADEQGYMTPDNDSTLTLLEKRLGSDLRRDLEFKKGEIRDYLAEEIASRYYGDGGRVAVEIRTDPVVETAVAILESPQYDAILRKTPDGKPTTENAKRKK